MPSDLIKAIGLAFSMLGGAAVAICYSISTLTPGLGAVTRVVWWIVIGTVVGGVAWKLVAWKLLPPDRPLQ